jgi:hypothetical protein
MQNGFSVLGRVAALAITVFLSACAGYSGSNLKPGVATLPEVMASMGEPAMRWKDPDGRQQLAYPRGPAGTQTFMVFIGADGRLERIDGVLDMEHFARIEAGKSDQSSVLRLLGPSAPLRTQYYRLSNELAWEWRFCDGGSRLALFSVMFDASTGIVRTSYQRPDDSGWDSSPPFCGH